MRLRLLIVLGFLLPVCAVRADEAKLDSIDAFEHAYGASFYEFDACGDSLAGRTYRRALAEKFAQCPFSSDARARFQTRATAQRIKASRAIGKMVEQNGGLPVKLDGMTRTCHEQADSPEYRAVRTLLDEYADGKARTDAVVPASCDASVIQP